MLIANWSYDGDDPGLRLFTVCNPKLPAGGPRVYEIGACDTDWIERVMACDPSKNVRGMDWREEPRACMDRGDVLTMDLPVADAFVGISSIEHVGLGNYTDPVDADGDMKAVRRLKDALAPGGFLYMDVPYAPEGYWQLGRKCRIYDDASLFTRFGPHAVLAYADPSGNEMEKPTKNRNTKDGRPYWYVALFLRKDDA